MQTDTYVFVVWAHRSADSIFGAASNPVMRNGKLLCFKTEESARREGDRLNAGTGGTYVRYSVRPVHVQCELPGGVVREASAEPRHASPLASRTAEPRAA